MIEPRRLREADQFRFHVGVGRVVVFVETDAVGCSFRLRRSQRERSVEGIVAAARERVLAGTSSFERRRVGRRSRTTFVVIVISSAHVPFFRRQIYQHPAVFFDLVDSEPFFGLFDEYVSYERQNDVI